jgi:hypothetical protein
MKHIIKYFKELLCTLNRIESHLSKIASCVNENNRGYGDKNTFSTKHWNDKMY